MRKIVFLLAILVSCLAFAKPPPADKVFKFSAQITAQQVVTLQWKIARKCYLYHDRFSFKIIKPPTAHLGKVIFPRGKTKTDEIFGTYQIYTKTLKIPIPIINAGNKNINLYVHYQGCSEDGYCYPPIAHKVTVNFSKNFVQIDASHFQPKQQKITQLLEHGRTIIILLSFLGFGLLLAFTPCVLPIIPILSGIIVGTYKNINTTKAFCLSLVYVLSMAVTYAIAGIIVSLFGQNLQAELQNPWVLIIFSLLFVLLALSLFGLFELRLPQKLQQYISAISTKQKTGTYLGVAVMGVLSTLIVSPCVTPPLIGALVYIGKTGNIFLGGSALFALGLGMGIPLLLIGTAFGKFLPKAGNWMRWIQIIFGIIMLLMAGWMVSRIYSPQHITSQFRQVKTINDVKNQVAKATAQGKPVILDFYADWCISCKKMEYKTFIDPKIRKLLANFVVLKADVTANDMQDKKLEKNFGVVAPPTFIFFDAKGKELKRYELIGEMDTKSFYKYLLLIPKE